MKQQKLEIRDFAFVHDEVIGPSYQNCAYAILVGAGSYACTYQGQTIAWDVRDIVSAVEACANHEAARKAQEAK
jgi:hypothetical protein